MTVPDGVTVAMPVLLVLHVPPPVPSLNVPVDPTQYADGPVTGEIAAPTVNATVVVHPPCEYEIVVLPVATPYTTPVTDTVAALVLLLLQIPPPVRSVNGVVDPTQTEVPPVICAKVATVTARVAGHVPPTA